MKDYSSHSWQLADRIAFHPVHKHIVQSICANVQLDGWCGWSVVDLLNPKKKKNCFERSAVPLNDHEGELVLTI